MQYNIAISLENPYRSWFWAAILALVQAQNNPALTKFWDSLTEVFFHNCCHGGQRKKGTRWKSSPGVFHTLSATCQNDHDHLPYQVHTEDGTWIFDTASEAAYPELLTQRVAAAIRNFLSPRNFSFAPPPNPRLTSLAMQHRQHKKRRQLIPEFAHIHWFSPNHKIQDFQKLLPSSHQGEYQEEAQPHSEKDILVGTWHTPEEFVREAQSAVHPMDECALNKITKDAIDFVVKSDPRLVSIERKKNLLKAKILAKQLAGDEKSLHESLPESVEKVVSDKKILLWQTLLEQNGYDDMDVTKFMKSGVPLVGAHDHPPCYPLKPKLASLTEAELRSSAISCRVALENRRPQTDAQGFAEHLESTALEEVGMKFLDGPYYADTEVTDIFGHPNWRIMRRFVIEQGAKLRPIDDGLEAQLNSAYTSTIRLDLQDADYVTALALELGKTPELNWMGKTLDLSKAYKQLPIAPHHRDLAVVFFRDKNGDPRYYIPNALMFGSTAAVYAFNRVSRSLWFLINKFLKVPSAVYFDDYPMFSPEGAAAETDALVSDFLDLLGWRHDRTGPKGKPFQPTFDVLGMSLQLAGLPESRTITLGNKEGRIEKISLKVQKVQEAGQMTLADAQEIHGLLNFATGYFAGRALRYACFKIFSLVDKGDSKSPRLKKWCEEVLVLLESVQPRTIPVGINTNTVLIFTDGSWEAGVAGIGAVLLDESSGARIVVQDRVQSDLLALWKDLVGDHLICQIELLAMVLVRWQWRQELHNRRVLLFVDNNSARGGVVKGRSNSPSMDDLLKAFFSVEVHLPSFWWIERVPSKSNPADEPSRFEGRAAAVRWSAKFISEFSCQSLVANWLVKAAQSRKHG